MPTLSLDKLASFEPLQKVVIQSLDLALYRLLLEHDGETYLILDKQSKVLQSRSLLAMKEILQHYAIEKLVLRHESAYDEMIGHPNKQSSNALEVSLGRELYPAPKTIH